MIKFGPSGRSNDFLGKDTGELAAWLSRFGLNAFEYSLGRGVRISSETAQSFGAEFAKCNISVSVHAPYFINLATAEADKAQKNLGYFSASVKICNAMGGNRVVFHPGSPVGLSAKEARLALRKNFDAVLQSLQGKDVILCAETMGKRGQIGSVEDIISICGHADNVYPCVDFGHLHARYQGFFKTKDDYRRVIDDFFTGIGDRKTKNMHVHFSKIEYGLAGERKHLTFADTAFGPEFEPLLEIIHEYGMTPTILTESDGTQTADAIKMKKYWDILQSQSES